MRVMILYHPASEHEGRVQDYIREYRSLHPSTDFELLSLETRQGADTAALYDATNYPAILVVSNDGQLLQIWQDEQLPLMKELDFYTQQ